MEFSQSKLLLPARDFIINISTTFTSATPQVINGSNPKFIIRGIVPRKVLVDKEESLVEGGGEGGSPADGGLHEETSDEEYLCDAHDSMFDDDCESDDEPNLIGSVGARIICRSAIRREFWQEMECPSQDTSQLAFELFDWYAILQTSKTLQA